MSPGTKQSTEIRTEDVTVDDDMAAQIVEQPSIVLRKGPVNQAGEAAVNQTARTTGARRWLRPGLMALLPLALIAGGYVYVTGGRVMSTENAYVEAEKVEISTDVSGVVRSIEVTENQKVGAGGVLVCLDDPPFRLLRPRE